MTNNSEPQTPVPLKQKKSLLPKVGCACFLIIILVILGVSFFGGHLLRSYVEKALHDAVGLPVKIGGVRASIFGRPSLSLAEIEIGKEGMLKVEHLTLTINAWQRLFGDAVVVNLDVGGLTCKLAEEPGRKGSDFAIICAALLKSEGGSANWAVPDLNIRDFNLVLTGKKKNFTLSLAAFSLQGLSSGSFGSASQKLNLELRSAGIKYGVKQLAKLAHFRIKLSHDISSYVVDSINLGQGNYEDLILPSGRTGFGDLWVRLRQVAAVLESSKPAGIKPVAKAIQVNALSIGPSTFALEEALDKGDEIDSLVSLRLNSLGIEKLNLDSQNRLEIIKLQLDKLQFVDKQEDAATNISLAQFNLPQADLNLNHWLDIRKLRFQVKNLLSSVKSRKQKNIFQLAGAEFRVGEKRGAEDLNIENMVLTGLELKLNISKGQGLTLPALLQENLAKRLSRFGLKSYGENKAESLLEKIKLQHAVLQNIHLTLEDSKIRTNKMVGQFNLKKISLENLKLNILKYNLDLQKVTGLGLRVQAGSKKTQTAAVALNKFACRQLKLSATALQELQYLQLENLKINNSADLQSSFVQLKEFKCELGEIGDQLELNNFTLDRLVATLNIDKDKQLAQIRSMRKAVVGLGDYFNENQYKGESYLEPYLQPVIFRKAKLTNVRLKLVDSSQPRQPNTLSFEFSSLKLSDFSLEQGVLKLPQLFLEGIKFDCYNVGNAGLGFALGKLDLQNIVYPAPAILSENMLANISGLVLRPRRPARTAYLSCKEMLFRLTSTQPLALRSLECDKLLADFRRTQDSGWDIKRSLELVKNQTAVMSEVFGRIFAFAGAGKKAKTAFSLALRRLDLNAAQFSISSTVGSNTATLVLSPGRLDLSGLVLLEEKQTLRLLFENLRSRLAQIDLLNEDDNLLRTTLETVSLSSFDSGRLERGTAVCVLAVNKGRLLSGQKTKLTNVLAFLGDISVSLQEVSEKRGIVRFVKWEKPHLHASLDKKGNLDFSSVAAFADKTLTLLAGKQRQPNKIYPIFIGSAELKNGIFSLNDSFTTKGRKNHKYNLLNLQISGRNLAYGFVQAGELACKSKLACSSLTPEAGDLTLDLTEIQLGYGLEQASFKGKFNAAKVPAALLNPMAETQGITFGNSQGTISLSSQGQALRGSLNFPIDLSMTGVRIKKKGYKYMLSPAFAALVKLFTLGIVSRESLVIKNAAELQGSIANPELNGNEETILNGMQRWLKKSVKSFKNLSKNPLGIFGLPGQKQENGSKQKQTDAAVKTVKPAAKTTNSAQTQKPKKKISKTEKRLKQLESIINIFKNH